MPLGGGSTWSDKEPTEGESIAHYLSQGLEFVDRLPFASLVPESSEPSVERVHDGRITTFLKRGSSFRLDFPSFSTPVEMAQEIRGKF